MPAFGYDFHAMLIPAIGACDSKLGGAGGSIVPDRDPSIDDIVSIEKPSLGMTRIWMIQSHKKKTWLEN